MWFFNVNGVFCNDISCYILFLENRAYIDNPTQDILKRMGPLYGDILRLKHDIIGTKNMTRHVR